jgi:hypothetical protein
MKKYSFGMAIAILLWTPTVFAQSTSVIKDTSLVINKSFESSDDKSEPATVSLSIPNGKSSSFMVNAGIGLQFSKAVIGSYGQYNSKTTISAFVVGNFNNLISDIQRNYKIGGNYSHLFGHDNITFVSAEGVQSVTGINYFTLNHTLEYTRDLEIPSHSLVYTIYFTQNRIKKQKGGLYLNEYKGNGVWQTYIGYNLGFELQDRFVADDPLLKGFILRNYHNAILRVAMRAHDKGIAKAFIPFAEFGVNYVGRYEIARSVDKKEGYLYLFKAELSIYPTQSEGFSVSFSYNNGSDPLNGLEKQQFYLLALKFKIN